MSGIFYTSTKWLHCTAIKIPFDGPASVFCNFARIAWFVVHSSSKNRLIPWKLKYVTFNPLCSSTHYITHAISVAQNAIENNRSLAQRTSFPSIYETHTDGAWCELRRKKHKKRLTFATGVKIIITYNSWATTTHRYYSFLFYHFFFACSRQHRRLLRMK